MSQNVMEGHERSGKSWKVMKGHERSFPIIRLTFQVRKFMGHSVQSALLEVMVVI